MAENGGQTSGHTHTHTPDVLDKDIYVHIHTHTHIFRCPRITIIPASLYHKHKTFFPLS